MVHDVSNDITSITSTIIFFYSLVRLSQEGQIINCNKKEMLNWYLLLLLLQVFH